MDKDWKSALSVQEFLDLKSNVEQEHREKELNVDNSRRKRVKRTTKKPLTVAGYDMDEDVKYAGPSGHIFDGLNFCKLCIGQLGLSIDGVLTMRGRYSNRFECARQENKA
jgi:hypothetical protein